MGLKCGVRGWSACGGVGCRGCGGGAGGRWAGDGTKVCVFKVGWRWVLGGLMWRGSLWGGRVGHDGRAKRVGSKGVA